MINKFRLISMTIFLILFMGSSYGEDTPAVSVSISSFSFQPDSITIAAGSTVLWTNEDSAPHTVTADDGSFESGRMNRGDEFEHTFLQPGTYEYHCALHPSMRAEVIVSEAEAASSMPAVGLELVAEGLVAPMGFVSAGDGRMFIVEQTGLIRLMQADGTILYEPFLDISDRMVQISPGYDERGLLGLALHPEFSENGRLFVFYSAPLRDGAPEGWSCTNHISEFGVSEDNPNQVDMNSERILLEIDKPQGNHNGGGIAFGPDGYLYVPLGDGGGADDVGMGHAPEGNGQNTQTFLGKILRIDVDRRDEGLPYGIPSDNPFLVSEDILPEIWALGFRNPWMITFDKGGEHELFVSDAGQNLWEEVDLVTRGGNYGWNIREGTHCFDPENPNESPASCPETGSRGEPLIDPIIEYGHDLGTVVVGGYVYRGMAMSEMEGKYIFADWSNDFGKGNGTLLIASPSSEGLWMWKELMVADSSNGRIDAFIRGFGQDDEGEIYVLTSSEMGPANQTAKIFKMTPP